MVTFLFLMVCPLFFNSYFLEPSNVPRFLIVVSLVFIVLVKWLFQKRAIYSPPSFLLILLTGYYVLNLVSVSWSLNSADGIYESQKIFLVPSILLLFLSWLQAEGEEHLLVKSLIIIALLYDVYAIFEIIRLPDLNFETLYDIGAFAEHKNLLASYLFLLMAFALYGLIYFQRTWRLFAGIVFVITFLLVIFVQTRSVYFALVLSGIVFLFYSRKHLKISEKAGITMASALVVLFVLMLIAYPVLLQRINIFSYSTSASGSERLKVWANTFFLIKENPLFGVGAGNWQYNFSKYGIGNIKNISQNEITFQRPHNDLLWILSESGIVGSLFILLIIAFVFIRSYPSIKAGNLKVLIFFSFLSGLLTESFFSFPKERITHIFLASVMLALLLKHLDLKTQLTIKTSRTISLILLCILGFSGVAGIFRLKGEYNTVLLLQAKEKNDPAKVLTYGDKAISLFYKSDPTSTPIYSYMGWAYNAFNKTDSLLYVSKLAYELAPYDHEVLSNYGSALERSGKREDAREILKEALRINPFYEPALINLVVVEYNSKNFKKALEYLMRVPGYDIKYKAYLDKINSKLQLN